MKRNKWLSRIVSGLLTAALVLSLCPAVSAAEGRVSIGTLEELTAFAQRCASDRYSEGLEAVLTADIDAGGTAVSVPIFLGSFDGQGHKITGLRLEESNSVYGLFSRIEAGGTVQNLTIEGEVSPSGTQNKVGGLAGENYGSIESYRFSGLVSGGEAVGGIAGYNEGTVTDCTVSGVVRGTRYTGGIAGQNAGTLLRCENGAAVNTTVTEETWSADNLENLESSLYSILKKEGVAETAVTTDTGGVAGYSTGAIQSCVNTGSVGYPHVGYNVGGIAGRQNGYLASCVNRGDIQGRKDVGGIVGQMVPDITLDTSPGALEELQNELNTLQNLIDRTLDDAQSASDTVTGRVSRISNYADSAQDSAHTLTGQVGDFVDNNVSTANNLLLLAERYIGKAAPILSELSAASRSVAESISGARDLVEMLDDGLAYNDQFLAQLQSFYTETKAACDDLAAALDELERALELIDDGPALPDTSQLRADIDALREAAGNLEATIGRAMEEIGISGVVTPDTAAQLLRELKAVLDGYAAVNRDAADILLHTDFGALRDMNEETLRQFAQAIENAVSGFSSAASHFGSAMEHLRQALGTLRIINARADKVLGQADDTLASAQDAANSFSRAMSKAARWSRDLSREDPGTFSPLGQSFDDSSDALNASLSGISTELSALNSEINSSSTVLLSDLRAVNDQFMKVMNQFLNILNNTQNLDYTDIFEDVSEESLESASRGKVLECENRGAVTGDRNAGGIAGSMAIEYDLDPEDDLLSSDDRSSHFTYQTKAILLDCSNYGPVQAKKSCAGGVTGRMDLGTVSRCSGWGDVSSESGDYVGGVAGLSLSSVRESSAKCTLSGGKYVGGIVGSGSRVSDCVSMVEIADCTQLGGAIAGEITGEYSGNRFVSDTLAGVDRVSLSGKAEPVDYDALCQSEDLPENFRKLTLTFTADGETLKEVPFNYGASFSAEVYPEAPEKEWYYVQWSTDSLDALCFDTVVTAEYEPYVTTLAAEPGEDGRPGILAEGNFRQGDQLQVEKSTVPVPGSDDLVETWTLELPGDNQEEHTVRWRLPDGKKRYVVYTDSGSGWEEAESEVIGSYLCFSMTGSGRFSVTPADRVSWEIWAGLAGGCGAALVVLLLCLIVKKKKKKAE